jgi:Subtilase family
VTPGNGVDDDANGFVDDVHGWDFWDSDNDPDDFHGHGSHIAGTIAARANNQTGIAGVAPEAKVMPVRVLNEDSRGRTADGANGIVYAALNGADIVNYSIGTDPDPDVPMPQVERDALDIAAATDTLVVVAAMNNSKDNDTGHTPTWPCNFTHPNLICVASLDSNGALSDYSNYGATSVDVGAPAGQSGAWRPSGSASSHPASTTSRPTSSAAGSATAPGRAPTSRHSAGTTRSRTARAVSTRTTRLAGSRLHTGPTSLDARGAGSSIP